VKLEDMKADERFVVTALPYLKGVVLHVGSCGVRVKWDGSDQKRTIKDVDGEVQAEFTAPGKPMLISGHTEVTRV
jgi:hypothetical protein